MAENSVPSLGNSSFVCPHCKAKSHQTWYRVFARECERDSPPSVWNESDRQPKVSETPSGTEFNRFTPDILAYIDKQSLGRPFLYPFENDDFAHERIDNVFLSFCYSCREYSIWLHNSLIYPNQSFLHEPAEDMPPDVAFDFIEASKIVEVSPRGACAMLRLAIQKLCKHLGENGQNINDDIAALVKKGLNIKVQKALDVVRVVGNEAVHPGELNLRDDRETAYTLFDLVNYIVHNQITRPKEIEEIYAKLPEGKRQAIEKRDASTSTASKSAAP